MKKKTKIERFASIPEHPKKHAIVSEFRFYMYICIGISK